MFPFFHTVRIQAHPAVKKKCGLTQEKLAEHLSTTMQYSSRLERAENKVFIEYLYSHAFTPKEVLF